MKKLIQYILFVFIGVNVGEVYCKNRVFIDIDGYKYGETIWQYSSNGRTWVNMVDSIGRSILIDDHIPAYYRAQVTHGTCDPWFSSIYITGSKIIPMVFVDGGSFMMGSNNDPMAYSNEMPEKEVSVNSFYVSMFEINNSQFAQFLNDKKVGEDGRYETKNNGNQILITPYKWSLEYVNNRWQSTIGYELFPVVNVSWYGANEFCLWAGGRLLTESEWEYAARGGKESQRYLYSGSNTADSVAWCSINAKFQNKQIGTKLSNELGVYDMSGNVWEWCEDTYQHTSYNVLRGGSSYSSPQLARNTLRYFLSPTSQYNSVGFRLYKPVSNSLNK